MRLVFLFRPHIVNTPSDPETAEILYWPGTFSNVAILGVNICFLFQKLALKLIRETFYSRRPSSCKAGRDIVVSEEQYKVRVLAR